MKNETAWMLRNDGNSFPVKVHIYVMDNDDLSSEAEAASFILATHSQDKELCEEVLSAWMALLLENKVYLDISYDDLIETLKNCLRTLPYKFPYSLTESEYVNIFCEKSKVVNMDQLYDYVDEVRESLSQLSSRIKSSLNQQFCRSRYGGQYDTYSGNSCMWYRISSEGFNWANVIYLDISEKKKRYPTDSISICRDYESDYGDDLNQKEYFYKAKDGSAYYMMPLDEFLREEHEHSMVFSSEFTSGVISYIRRMLRSGSTCETILNSSRFPNNLNMDDIYACMKKIIDSEIRSQCIEATEFMDSLPTRSKSKVNEILSGIKSRYNYIDNVTVSDYSLRANRTGNMVGFNMEFEIESNKYEVLDHLKITVAFSKSFGSTPAGSIIRSFCKEFEDYKRFSNIVLK